MDLEDLSQEEIQVIMEQIEEEIILDEEMSEDDDDGVIDEGGDKVRHVRLRKADRKKDRGYAIRQMDEMANDAPEDFRKMFRLPPELFNKLLRRVSPNMKDDTRPSNLRSNAFIPKKTKLAATLRWLAGGAYQDICFAFGIAPSAFYADEGVLWGIMTALDKTLVIEFPTTDRF